MNKTRKKQLFIKIVVPFAMLMFFFISAKGQINYVQNPSFEMYDTCPDTYGQIDYTIYWSDLIDHSGGSPDFMHACANPNTNVGVPANYSYQMSRTGLGYTRLALFEYSTAAPNMVGSEYMNSKLTKTLIANKQYCVKAHLSLCEFSYCLVDGFGMYFDNGTYSWLTSGQVTVQIDNPDFAYLSDSTGWIEVSGTFVANGTEEYITLGNFKSLQTHYLPTANDPGSGYYLSVYYIDDVSVIESDLPAFAGNDTALQNIGDSLYLGRPAEIGLECIWYNWAGDSIGTGAGIWVTPLHTMPYIVEQNLCGTIKRDTVYVSVGTSIENGATLQGIKVFPNPSQGSFRIILPTSENREIAFSIYELSGKEVYYSQQIGKDEIQITTDLPVGMYLLHIQDVHTGAKVVRRVVFMD